MPHQLNKRSEKTGLPPGSFIYIGEHKKEEVKITVIDYHEHEYKTTTCRTIEETFAYKDSATVTWINIDGLHEITLLEQLSRHFDIHPLTIEDILNNQQRPKIELFDNYIFIILKMVSYRNEHFSVEQVSLILGKGFLITFQEVEGDIFEPIRKRLANGIGRVRKSGADYLAYAIIDIIVDHYFLILERLSEKIEAIEETVFENPDQGIVKQLHLVKRDLIELRKTIFPLREVVNTLQQGESAFIKKSTTRYIRDLYDHTIQIIDAIETYREMVSSTLELYLSTISMKMNEVMKVLTVIATIFIPLSFLAGVYGMNFDTSVSIFNMPELSFPFGYLVFWIVCILITSGFIMFFKRRNWL